MGVNLPFFGTISKEAYDAYLIAQYMLNNPGSTIGRAAFQLSKGTWDAARLANGLTKVTEEKVNTFRLLHLSNRQFSKGVGGDESLYIMLLIETVR